MIGNLFILSMIIFNFVVLTQSSLGVAAVPVLFGIDFIVWALWLARKLYLEKTSDRIFWVLVTEGPYMTPDEVMQYYSRMVTLRKKCDQNEGGHVLESGRYFDFGYLKCVLLDKNMTLTKKISMIQDELSGEE